MTPKNREVLERRLIHAAQAALAAKYWVSSVDVLLVLLVK